MEDDAVDEALRARFMEEYGRSLKLVEEREKRQAEAEEERRHHKSAVEDNMSILGTIRTNIDCCRSVYEHLLGNGQKVSLVRDHSVLNGIRAVDPMHRHVGYIHRSPARVLAPLLDSRSITVRCIITVPTTGKMSVIPCLIYISARDKDFDSIESSILTACPDFVRFNDASVFSSSWDEEVYPPEEFITTELLLHQRQGLSWLSHREKSIDLPPFWALRGSLYVCSVSPEVTSLEKPKPVRGGVLADDAGLGKTLTFLALIALDKSQRNGIQGECPSPEATLVVCPSRRLSRWGSQITEHTRNLRACQFNNGSTIDAKDLQQNDIVLTTYDTLFSEFINRHNQSPLYTTKWRRVILDEERSLKDLKAREISALRNLKSQRRWASTGISLQAGSLDLFPLVAFLDIDPFSGESFWIDLVDGPVGGRLESRLSRLLRLQALMKPISLRRTKDENLVGFPAKSEEILYVELSAKERSLYNQIESNARGLEWNRVTSNKVSPSFDSVLGIVSQLCQVCTADVLCSSDSGLSILPMDDEDSCEKLELSGNLTSVLQGISPRTDIRILSFDENFERSSWPISQCSLSKSDLSSQPESVKFVSDVGGSSSKVDALISPRTGIRILSFDENFNRSSWPINRCSLSKSDLSSQPESVKFVSDVGGTSSKVDALISPQTGIRILSFDENFNRSSWPINRCSLSKSDLSSQPESGQSVSAVGGISSKVDALLNLLSSSRDQNPAIKSVVFSHFREVLILLQKPLEAARYKTFFLDEIMNAERSEQMIKEFMVTGSDVPTVLLVCFKASGTGINLTAAARVYLMDPWLDLAFEEQAMNSVYKIGQKQDVKVVRMIARNTVEEKLLALLEKKKKLAKGEFLLFKGLFHRRVRRDEGKLVEIGLDDLRALLSL